MQEILIVGAGIIGLSIARALRKEGVGRIKIIERKKTGKEASFAAAGMLAPHVEAERKDAFFKFCAESNKLYNEFVSEIFDETGIDVEFRANGIVYLAFTEDDLKKLKHRYEWQSKAKIKVEFLQAHEIRRIEPFVSPDVLAGLIYPEDGQVENRKLLAALERFLRSSGIEILQDTEITNLIARNSKIEAVETKKGERIFADVVILASGAWTSLIRLNNQSLTLSEIKPIRGQMIAFRTTKKFFEHVLYSPRGYVVPREDGRILVGATVEDVGFNKEVTNFGVDFLSDVGLEISPSLSNLKISEKWAGLRPMSSDGLPVLGEFPEVKNLFIATGHYRNGILLAPITAKVIAEKITKNVDSEYLRLFSPSRFLIG
ncbi:MAG: glycine oxidase ThiO [Acidobacteria bacterium]|jgi:glycine oxidase|nr:MAG: glycine oxidase ThiO [Acidobacteriota bacterium]GIU82865.1 MAG: glycine oxidase ThiO [Pyrinomonadaceae bacterium]